MGSEVRALELKSSSLRVVRLVQVSGDELKVSGATSGSEGRESRFVQIGGQGVSVPRISEALLSDVSTQPSPLGSSLAFPPCHALIDMDLPGIILD